MAKSLKYFLSLFVLIAFFSCKNNSKLYHKILSNKEKTQLSKSLTQSVQHYYQGSAAEIAILEEALRFDSNNVEALRERGIPYLKRGIASNMWLYFNPMIQKGPQEWAGYAGHCFLYLYKDYQRAYDLMTLYDSFTPNFVDYPMSTSVYFYQAICQMQLGHLERANHYFDLFLEEELKHATLDYVDIRFFLYQGIAFYKEKKYKEAQDVFLWGLKECNPENANLWFWLSKTYIAEENKESARTALEKASKHYKLGDHNRRTYTEDFYQIYSEDLLELREIIRTLK